MPQNSEDPEKLQPNPEQGFKAVYFAADCGFWCAAPFLRSEIGKRAIGFPALWAGCFMFWYAAMQRSEAMLFYVWSWLGMVIYRRLTPGEGVSEHQGIPYVTMWLIKDELLARILEAVGVWVIGNYVMPHSEPMGKFLVWVSLLMGVKCWIERLYLTRRKEIARDAILQMRQMMNEMREE